MNKLLILLLLTTSAFAQVVENAHLRGTTNNVQTQLNAKLPVAGGTMTGPINFGGQIAVNLGTPSASTDAATKSYVDTKAGLYLPIAGGTMTGPINFGGQIAGNLGTPSASTDAATKSYVDTKAGLYLPLAGGTMSGALNMGSQRITLLGTPTTSTDAATKAYVDTAIGNVNVAAAFPDSMGEITRLRQLMAGTGRAGIMVWPQNKDTAGITTNNGDGFAITRCVRRVPTSSQPQYWYLREMGTNTWMGYLTQSTTFGTTNETAPNVLYYRTLKPMLKYRVDAGGAVTDKDGGSVAYPMLTNVANNTITFSTATINTSTRRLGVILGGTYTFGALCKVTITNNTTSANVIPNLLPTVQNGIDNLSWSSGVTALGELTTSDYVLDTQGAQMMLHNQWHVPIADNLDPGSYTVTITLTQQKNNDVSHSGAQRAYIAYFTYGGDGTTEATSGATLEVFGPASYRQKVSTSETYTFEVRPQGQGSYELIGCNHVNSGRSGEQLDSLAHTVDGQTIIPWAKTATRARASNVATITTASPHGLVTGDLVTVSKVGAIAYNAEDLSVTVTGLTTFTYANTGTDEGSTADTAGFMVNQRLWLGQKIMQRRATSLWHSSTNTPVMSSDVTYVFDRSGWISGSVITALMPIDLEKTTYLGLNTVYGGTTWGPEFPGQVNWRVIGTTTAGTFSDTTTTDANVTASYGKHAGFLVWGPTRATAYFCESPNLQMANWAYGNFFAQDRGSSTGARGTACSSKFYFQYTTTNAVTGISSGTVFRVRCTRLDADVTSAASLFQ